MVIFHGHVSHNQRLSSLQLYSWGESNQGSHHGGEPQLPLTDLCKEVEEVARHEEEGAELSWASELSFFFLWTHGELFGVNCWDANSEYMAYECLWQFLWHFYHSKNGDIYMRHRDTQTNGGFLKWGHPQIIHLNRNFQYKPSFFGYPHLWKPPSLGIFRTSLTSRLWCCLPNTCE